MGTASSLISDTPLIGRILNLRSVRVHNVPDAAARGGAGGSDTDAPRPLSLQLPAHGEPAAAGLLSERSIGSKSTPAWVGSPIRRRRARLRGPAVAGLGLRSPGSSRRTVSSTPSPLGTPPSFHWPRERSRFNFVERVLEFPRENVRSPEEWAALRRRSLCRAAFRCRLVVQLVCVMLNQGYVAVRRCSAMFQWCDGGCEQ